MAIAQSTRVADQLTARTGRAVEIVGIVTSGDTSKAQLAQIGGTGVFVSALRDSLKSGQIDFAVHSLKDLPTWPDEAIALAAVPERDDPRDALAARNGAKLADLHGGARIGTGSPRRAAQLLLLRPDVEPVPIRGNAGTRLAKVDVGEVDAVVLAYAGLARIGRLDVVSQVFEPDEMLPAPGQGALAVECLASRVDLAELLASVNHQFSRAATRAERAVLTALQAGCSAPIGAYAAGTNELRLDAVVVSADGGAAGAAGAALGRQPSAIRASARGPVAEAGRLGQVVAAELLARGANNYTGVSAGHQSDGEDAK